MTKKICFLVGSPGLSNRTYVIFQHASLLRDHGFDVTVAIAAPFNEKTLAWADKGPQLPCVSIDRARRGSFDLVIATTWNTALELSGFDTDRYSYFVQSIETFFYSPAEGPLRTLVETTYRMPVNYVTVTNRIKKYLQFAFGQEAALVRSGIRKDIYYEHGPVIAPRPAGHLRVLIEGDFDNPFNNTVLAVRLARKAGAKDIWVMTDSSLHHLPGVSRVFSRVPIHLMPQIYRSCDILLKLNGAEGMLHSPLEMFHCGGSAIVFDDNGRDDYTRANENAVVVAAGDQSSVVLQLERLILDRERLASMKRCALMTASHCPSWEQSASEFAGWIRTALAGKRTDWEALSTMIAEARLNYERAEKLRLCRNPTIAFRYKLEKLARRHFAPSVRDKLREFCAMVEVSLPLRGLK